MKANEPMRIVGLIGHLKKGSRTAKITERMLSFLTNELASQGYAATQQTFELSELGVGLFTWGDPEVQKVIDQVRDAEIVLVASPTFKASYTGLLKSFLDLLPQDGLLGKLAIPLMVGASPHHSLAVELQLRPVLSELGAYCPAQGLYVLDSQMEILDDVLNGWMERNMVTFAPWTATAVEEKGGEVFRIAEESAAK